MIDFITATDTTVAASLRHVAKATPAGYAFVCDAEFTSGGSPVRAEGDINCPDCQAIDLTEITW